MKSIFKKLILLFLTVLLFGLAIWAFIIEPNQLFVKNYEIKVQKWSPKLNGLKIVAISDIHGGSNFINEEKIRQIVRETNAQNPDIIVLLGDYISRKTFQRNEIRMPLETLLENLRGLKAKYGVYAVIGNQDNEFDGEKIRAGLEGIGYKVLENEAVAIKYQNGWIRLLGTSDVLKAGNNWNQIKKDLQTALEKLETKEGKIIVLTHSPDAIVYMTEELSISDDFALLIAGHTHGGQCRFPIIGAPIVPSEFGKKYVAGHVRDRGIDMFVTTGIGTSFLPARFGVPPEISVLQIYAE